MKSYIVKNGVLLVYKGKASHITIPKNVTKIGCGAFRNHKGLASVKIPSGVTCIGDYAFQDCTDLTNIEIPSSVTRIGQYAFQDCTGLTSAVIPNSVTYIGRDAFLRVKNIVYSGNKGGRGALTRNGIIDGDFIYSDTKKTHLTAYIGGGGEVAIPNGVTRIGDWAFFRCLGLTSIEIPSSVKSIGYGTFECCSLLRRVEIPSNVKSIGGSAFWGCTCLTSIEIPNGVTSIGGWAFGDCTCLSHIEIPSSVTSIGENAFQLCYSLKHIEIPSSVTSIGENAFYGIADVKNQHTPNGALRAFKAFDKHWMCRDFRYAVGQTYHQDGIIQVCKNGFHAYSSPMAVFNHYSGSLKDLHFAEVEMSGELDFRHNMVAASDIRIVKELTASELADIYSSMAKF